MAGSRSTSIIRWKHAK